MSAPKRKREVQLNFRVSPEELALIEQKMAQLLSLIHIWSTGTTCAATPRTSASPTTIWARAAPRPSTRPMWRRSSC